MARSLQILKENWLTDLYRFSRKAQHGGGTLSDFSTLLLNIRKTSKTFKGDYLKTLKFFRKNVSQCQKKLRTGPLVSPGLYVALKKGTTFSLSSLGQMVQFDTLKFRRAFNNYFGQFALIEKSQQYSRVSLHEAPTTNDFCNGDEKS